MFAVPTSESRSQVRHILRRTADLFTLLFGTRIGLYVIQLLKPGTQSGALISEHFSGALIIVMMIYILVPVSLNQLGWIRRITFLLIFSTVASAVHCLW